MLVLKSVVFFGSTFCWIKELVDPIRTWISQILSSDKKSKCVATLPIIPLLGTSPPPPNHSKFSIYEKNFICSALSTPHHCTTRKEDISFFTWTQCHCGARFRLKEWSIKRPTMTQQHTVSFNNTIFSLDTQTLTKILNCNQKIPLAYTTKFFHLQNAYLHFGCLKSAHAKSPLRKTIKNQPFLICLKRLETDT